MFPLYTYSTKFDKRRQGKDRRKAAPVRSRLILSLNHPERCLLRLPQSYMLFYPVQLPMKCSKLFFAYGFNRLHPYVHFAEAQSLNDDVLIDATHVHLQLLQLIEAGVKLEAEPLHVLPQLRDAQKSRQPFAEHVSRSPLPEA